MQDDELLAKYPPDDKQRFDQYSQVGQVLDQFLDVGLNFTVPTMPTLRPKLRKVPRKSLSMAMAFDCSSLRWVMYGRARVQKESDYQRSVRVRSCIRPVVAWRITSVAMQPLWPLALM